MSIMIDCCVADYMTQDVVSVHQNEDLTRAIGMLDQLDLSVLPVVNDAGHVCGILSNSDLIGMTYSLKCDISVLTYVSECVRKTLVDALEEDNRCVKVSSVMTSDVQTIRDDVSIEVAAEKLIACGVHHLPVVNSDNMPIGIIGTTDIVRVVADAKKKPIVCKSEVENPG